MRTLAELLGPIDPRQQARPNIVAGKPSGRTVTENPPQQRRSAAQNAEAAPGSFRTVGEKELVPLVAQHPLVIVHFSNKWRPICKALDGCLGALARRYMGTLCLRVDADRSPGLMARYRLKAAPAIVYFSNGSAEGVLDTLQPFGGTTNFSQAAFEHYFLKSGMLAEAPLPPEAPGESKPPGGAAQGGEARAQADALLLMGARQGNISTCVEAKEAGAFLQCRREHDGRGALHLAALGGHREA